MPNLLDITSRRQQREIAFNDWKPDVPAFSSDGFPLLFNAYPSDIGLYKPILAPAIESLNSITGLVAAATNNAGQLVGFRNPSTNAVFLYTAAADPIGDTMHFFE